MSIKVGDKIYLKRYGNLTKVEVVTKITRTMVKTDAHSYKIPTDDSGYIRMLGQGKWATYSCHLETPDLQEEWDGLLLKNWIHNNWDKIPLYEIKILKHKMESSE